MPRYEVGARLGFLEALGLRPFRKTLAEAGLAIRGDRYAKGSRFDLSSLRILRPGLAAKLWLGADEGRLAPVYNLFNRTPTPESEGWSVRKSQVRDYRGGALTYDSHNGTDFATAPGTRVVAAAAGRVVHVTSEYQRGGKKLMLDHGDGLATSYAHLGRVLVAPGQVVARGELVALSGASGINFTTSLLCDPPHLHFNVWLNGEAVDPFAMPGEQSLWGTGREPVPHAPGERDIPDTHYDHRAIDAWIDACIDPARRAELRAIGDDDLRAAATIFAGIYHPMRFPHRPMPYDKPHPRSPRIDLPLSHEDFEGVYYLQD
jgi:murein DD-endopeptidase